MNKPADRQRQRLAAGLWRTAMAGVMDSYQQHERSQERSQATGGRAGGGRAAVTRNLSLFYRDAEKAFDLIEDFVLVYRRARRRLRAAVDVDADEGRRLRALRALRHDAAEFHEIMEGLQHWYDRQAAKRSVDGVTHSPGWRKR